MKFIVLLLICLFAVAPVTYGEFTVTIDKDLDQISAGSSSASGGGVWVADDAADTVDLTTANSGYTVVMDGSASVANTLTVGDIVVSDSGVEGSLKLYEADATLGADLTGKDGVLYVGGAVIGGGDWSNTANNSTTGSLEVSKELTVGGTNAVFNFNDAAVSGQLQTNAKLCASLSDTGYLVTIEGDGKVDGDLTVVGTIYQDVEGSGAAGNVVTYDHLNDLKQAAMYQYQTDTLDGDFEIKAIEPIGKRQDKVLKLYSGAFKQTREWLIMLSIFISIGFIWLFFISIGIHGRK